MTDELYKELILEHARHPHQKGVLKCATTRASSNNPSCGDTMHVALTISDKGVVEEAMFNGDGCAISQAAASLLMVHILNKTIDELRIMTPGTIYSLLGVEVGPSRVQCALLAYETLSQALRKLDQSA